MAEKDEKIMVDEKNHTEDQEQEQKQQDTQQEEDSSSKTEKFFESNQQIVSVAVGIIVLLIGGYFAFQKFYIDPQEIRAQEQMFMAEKYFAADSLDKALNGDGNYDGFINIIDEYSLTKTANLAKYYTGIAYLKKADYENAIEYLNDFKSSDKMLGAIAKAGIGDAYVETGESQKAIDYYLEAAHDNENKFSTPLYLMKAASTFEELGDYAAAVDLYEQIKENYVESVQGKDIDKYIARARFKIEP